MAINTAVDDGSGGYVEPVPVTTGKDGKIGPYVLASFNNVLHAICRKFRHGISLGSGNNGTFGGNTDTQYIRVTTPNVADTEFTVYPGLGRVPVFVVGFGHKAGVIYASNYASWRADRIYLKCSATSQDALLWIW